MSQLANEIIFLGFLLFGCGLFAMAEIAIVTSRRARLQAMADEGDARAAMAVQLANNPGRFLSTVQLGITLVNVLAGTIGTEALPEYISHIFLPIPLLAPHAHAISVGIVVTIITFLSVVVGELVPKRLALNHPEAIAKAVAGPMDTLSRCFSWLVDLLNFSSDLLLGIIGIKKTAEPPVSEEEVRVLIDQGLSAGVFKKAEKEMVESVLDLDEQTVDDLMTPRAKMIWLSIDDDPENNWRRVAASGHSHFPVFQGVRDNVVGMASVKSLWANLSLAGNADLKSVLTSPLYVPTSMPAAKLIEEFQKTRRHLALCVDEFGAVQGLVTLNDLMEAIVGDLPDKEQRYKPQARKREDGTLLIDAMLEIEEAKLALGIKEFPGEEDDDYTTLGGFMLHQFGRIPKEGDTIPWGGWQFEIIDMDRQRIDKILAKQIAAPKPEAGPEI